MSILGILAKSEHNEQEEKKEHGKNVNVIALFVRKFFHLLGFLYGLSRSFLKLQILPSIIREYEEEAKIKEDLSKDAELQRKDWRISNARNEEQRLAVELEKTTARLEMLRVTRAEHIASTSTELHSAKKLNLSCAFSIVKTFYKCVK